MKNKKYLIPVLAIALMGGGVAGITGLASAATSTATSNTSVAGTQQTQQPAFDASKGGHVGTNGFKEELLTGDLAAKATTAAQVAVPGGTVERVETDAEGAAYEAHVKKTDGSQVTVKFDASMNVSGIETGGPGMGR